MIHKMQCHASTLWLISVLSLLMSVVASYQPLNDPWLAMLYCNIKLYAVLFQSDGTWTDIPRCIEHDPGVEDQIPGLCPGIPGYCAQNFLNSLCKFDCPRGRDISSICTADGTWAPYPTCEGDLRETRDGCDGCPGAVGGRRNRTAEGILGLNRDSDRRVPKLIKNDGGRKTVPSFAGNINIGSIRSEKDKTSLRSNKQQRFKTFGQNARQGRPTPKAGPRITERPRSFFPTQERTQQATQKFRPESQQTPKPQRTQQFQQTQPPQSFGVFEAVYLGAKLGDPRTTESRSLPRTEQRPLQQNGDFFGVFQSINLQV